MLNKEDKVREVIFNIYLIILFAVLLLPSLRFIVPYFLIVVLFFYLLIVYFSRLLQQIFNHLLRPTYSTDQPINNLSHRMELLVSF